MISYQTVKSIQGPLVFIQKTENIGYQELVKIRDKYGKEVTGQVIALEKDVAVVQVFDNVAGLQIKEAEAIFTGETKKIALSPTILGRIFNGYGDPIDGKDKIKGVEVDVNEGFSANMKGPLPFRYNDINGKAINPFRRSEPHDFIQTGISAIDSNITVVKGQKIPIFSGSGLPDLEILSQIATKSQTNDPGDKFVVVVAAVGISYDQYVYLKEELDKSKALSRSVMFVNLASDPVVERILTPRLALTVSEYLAYELDFSVLTLIFDLTNYAGAMREISTAKKEIPGRSGYPGYLYTDLASLLERAGTVEGKKGSITQIPILTMPNDDVTHVVPDLTGYITEGQIVLDRSLHKQNIYPPINILPSLSRLKDKGQGEGKTREDHSQVADQLFASLAESNNQQELALVLGRDSLTETGKKYLEFSAMYHEKFLNQGRQSRSIAETLDTAWELFSILPSEELKKLKPAMVSKYGKAK
ncbi:MAG: V-type ATP synthase subunit B [Patescibacteria group bacterium]